jgi:hypothetical protein
MADRYTLRDLPTPAKLVVTVFLLSVGLGYVWAMVQLHFKHASPGEPMPGIKDVVAHFAGVPWPLEAMPHAKAPKNDAPKPADDANVAKVPGAKIKSILKDRCVTCHGIDGEKAEISLETYEQLSKYLEKKPDQPFGKLHMLMDGPSTGKLTKKTMVAAFFEKSDDWATMAEADKQKAKTQREAERNSLLEWIVAGAPQAPYEADAWAFGDAAKFTDLTAAYQTQAPKRDPNAVATKPAADKWKEAKSKQLSVEALTQSTHAHLLSFSMLWGLTGLIFAFTSYTTFIRCIVGPVVLIAQVADISCWWLARLDGIGPYFALAILGTGAVVGMGLGAQITLSLWNMYGGKGRAVILLLFLLGGAVFGVTYAKVIKPQLDAEKQLAVG